MLRDKILAKHDPQEYFTNVNYIYIYIFFLVKSERLFTSGVGFLWRGGTCAIEVRLRHVCSAAKRCHVIII